MSIPTGIGRGRFHATRFYLDSVRVRLCLRVLPLCRALQSLDIRGGGERRGKKYIFSKFLPRCLFDRWTNFVEGFDNFFLFSSFFFSSGFFVGILIPCLWEARILGIVSFAILSIRNLRKKELHEVDCNIKFFNWVFLGCKN